MELIIGQKYRIKDLSYIENWIERNEESDRGKALSRDELLPLAGTEWTLTRLKAHRGQPELSDQLEYYMGQKSFTIPKELIVETDYPMSEEMISALEKIRAKKFMFTDHSGPGGGTGYLYPMSECTVTPTTFNHIFLESPGSLNPSELDLRDIDLFLEEGVHTRSFEASEFSTITENCQVFNNPNDPNSQKAYHWSDGY